jgi:hypothetical protein
VINGFSDLMAEEIGEENGDGARSAVGMGALPTNIAVELECIFEVELRLGSRLKSIGPAGRKACRPVRVFPA